MNDGITAKDFKTEAEYKDFIFQRNHSLLAKMLDLDSPMLSPQFKAFLDDENTCISFMKFISRLPANAPEDPAVDMSASCIRERCHHHKGSLDKASSVLSVQDKAEMVAVKRSYRAMCLIATDKVSDSILPYFSAYKNIIVEMALDTFR